MTVLLNVPEKHWVCPNCDATHVSHEPRPHTPFHPCRGLRGVNAPYVEEGVKAKVELREREDYVGTEQVQRDGNGRPVMNITTTRDNGVDCAVLAPVATAERS